MIEAEVGNGRPDPWPHIWYKLSFASQDEYIADQTHYKEWESRENR